MALTSAEKSARYRAKDVDAYRERKAEEARRPHRRAVATEYMRKWREANREKSNRQAKESRDRHRDAINERQRRKHYVKKYGITVERKAEILAEQGGVCAICGGKAKREAGWHLDHCHTTGAVRGVLCNVCNTKLGWFEKNSHGIANYLGIKKE